MQAWVIQLIINSKAGSVREWVIPSFQIVISHYIERWSPSIQNVIPTTFWPFPAPTDSFHLHADPFHWESDTRVSDQLVSPLATILYLIHFHHSKIHSPFPVFVLPAIQHVPCCIWLLIQLLHEQRWVNRGQNGSGLPKSRRKKEKAAYYVAAEERNLRAEKEPKNSVFIAIYVTPGSLPMDILSKRWQYYINDRLNNTPR